MGVDGRLADDRGPGGHPGRCRDRVAGGVAVDLVRYNYKDKVCEALAALHQAGPALTATAAADANAEAPVRH